MLAYTFYENDKLVRTTFAQHVFKQQQGRICVGAFAAGAHAIVVE